MIGEGFRSALQLLTQGETDEEPRTYSSFDCPQSSVGALRAHCCSNLSVSLLHRPGTCSFVLSGDLHHHQSVEHWLWSLLHHSEYQFHGMAELDADVDLPGQWPGG